MSRDGKRRVLSYEERVLWSAITKTMKPLRPKNLGRGQWQSAAA